MSSNARLSANTFILLLFTGLLLTGCINRKPTSPQEAPVGNRKSPIAIASIKHDGTYIKVVYGQPYRRGRTIFGDWEPYGQVWRTGANEATEITLTKTVRFADEAIEAGTYSLFTIPYEDRWTIILNNGLGQWGAFDYNEDLDYIRFDVPVKTLDNPVEAFSISFDEPVLNSTTMKLSWGLVQAEIPVRFYDSN